MESDPYSIWNQFIEPIITREYFPLESPTESDQSNTSVVQGYFIDHQINSVTGQPNISTPHSTIQRNTMGTRRTLSRVLQPEEIEETGERIIFNDSYAEENRNQEQEQEIEDTTHTTDNSQLNMLQILNTLTQNLQAINQTTAANTGRTGNNPITIPRETKLVDLPEFKGGEQDPLIWLEEFDDACKANRINNERKIEIIPAYLKGIAHSWWNQIKTTTQYWDATYHQNHSFVPQFKTKWCTTHQKSRWMNQLRNRTQKSGETVDEYLDAIIRLYNKVDPDNRYPAEDALRQFINGLRDELREPVEISCPANLEEAVNRARAAEATFSRNAPLSSYSMKRNYLGQTTDEMKDIKEALNQLTQGFQQLVSLQNNRNTQSPVNNNIRRETRSCNNCGRTGHIARDCRSRPTTNNNFRPNRTTYNNNNNNNSNRNFTNNNNNNRRCFTCNQPGHLASQCPQRSGNQNNSTNRNSTNNNQSPGSNTGQNNNRNQWLNMSMEDFSAAVQHVNQHLND